MRRRYNQDTGEFEDDGLADDQRYDDEEQPRDLSPNDTLGPRFDDNPAPRPERDPLAGYNDADKDWLRRNQNPNGSYDFHRLREAQTNTPGGGSNNGGDGKPDPVSSAYGNYLGSNQNDGLTSAIQALVSQATADRQRQEQERAAMREILMGRLGKAQEPVSVDSPGIKELIAARKLESQRGSENERRVMAERMAAQGLGDSGAFDAGVMGLEQDRSERDSIATADILGGELQAKRQEIQYLLQLAASTGDAEAARTLQAQLATIDAQLQQENMAGVNRRFDSDLGFRKSSFMDDLSYRLLALQMGANQNAGLAFL